jgi:DNA transposition AAA+ family ATPase
MLAEHTTPPTAPNLRPSAEDVRARVEGIVAAGFSLTRLSVETGIPEDRLQRYLADDLSIGPSRIAGHRSSTEDEFNTIVTWLEEEDESKSGNVGYAATPTFQAIQAAMQLAVAGRLLVAITGGVGIGKSEAAKAFVSSRPRGHLRPGAVRVEFSDTDDRSSAALARIYAALSRSGYGGRMRGDASTAMLAAIEGALRPGDCLVLDECNYLRASADAVRSLYDRIHIPIVMIGNPDFGRGIFGTGSTFEALANRAIRRDFPRSTEEDVDAWLSWKGVSGIKLRRAAVAIACRPGATGGLRTLAQVFEIARTYYPQADIDGPLLQSVAAQIGR